MHTLTAVDGYHLLRPLGRGGFGEVWLAQSGALGDYHALKFIASDDTDLLERELAALIRYRQTSSLLRSLYLCPIEHINRYEAGLFYVMPLADGLPINGGVPDITDPSWEPLTLSAKIQNRSTQPRWFTLKQIAVMMIPVLRGLQQLSEAGLVHRDVKPDNILFFQGQPCLGDMSLLDHDKEIITRRGTPGYVTPSWYVGGHTDMYAAAATLYTLLTGNAPDKMGRESFLWPPQGKASLTPEEQSLWRQMHAVIRRATEEHPLERYLDFQAMAEAMKAVVDRRSKLPISRPSIPSVQSAQTSYNPLPPAPPNALAASPSESAVQQMQEAMAQRSRERMLKFGRWFLMWPSYKPGYWLNLMMGLIGLICAINIAPDKNIVFAIYLGISTSIRSILGANGVMWRKNLTYLVLTAYAFTLVMHLLSAIPKDKFKKPSDSDRKPWQTAPATSPRPSN